MITVNYQSDVPIYRQIYNQFVKLIIFKVLNPGDSMPTIRSLAADLGVNPNTVQRAFAMLENDGYIISVVGRGSVVSSEASVKNANYAKAEKDFEQAVDEAYKNGVSVDEMLKIVRKVTGND